jgi:hypothetical protein
MAKQRAGTAQTPKRAPKALTSAKKTPNSTKKAAKQARKAVRALRTPPKVAAAVLTTPGRTRCVPRAADGRGGRSRGAVDARKWTRPLMNVCTE